jgi:hypothetical protein
MTDIQLISTSDDRWPRMLASVPHDFYHLPAYCDVAAREDDGEAMALYGSEDGHRMLLPLVRRGIEGDGYDVSSPYGYPGPLVTAAADPSFLRRGLAAGIDLLAAQGYVSLFVRTHPLLSPQLPEDLATVVDHPPTIVIDLSLPDEDWLAGMRKSHRQQIARAQAAGHRAYIDEQWRHLDRFREIYRATMRRIGASEPYHFSDAYFDDLRRALGDSLKLCVVEFEGRVWTAGLFVETNGIVQSHLSGDDGSHRSSGAKKLMYAHVRDWAKARGDRWFHLGGGAPSRSLLSFKAGFSPAHCRFATLRAVLRPDAYRDLVATRRPDADPTDLTGYFPAYR